MPSEAFVSIDRPAGITPLPAGFRWSAGLIDYARHPAYADLLRNSSIGDRLAALWRWGSRLPPLIAKRIARYEAIPGEWRVGKTLGERTRFLGSAVRNAIVRPSNKRQVDAQSTLARDGVAVLHMPAASLAGLTVEAEPFFDTLVRRRGMGANRRAFDESRSSTSRATAPRLFAAIDRIFDESGLTAIATEYLGRVPQLVDVNPQINDPSDSFWREIFEDVPGAGLPRTAYCHRDASGGDLKVIIYMTDVGPGDGPFAYAVGSNRMTISSFDDLLCEANDHNGLSSTDAEARRLFAALPARLRQKCAFGNDLTDDTSEASAIADALWSITGPAGSIVAFDTKGIHRGGMVTDGSRRVLTCVLG